MENDEAPATSEAANIEVTYSYLVVQSLDGEVSVVTDPSLLHVGGLREASRTDVLSSARYVYDTLLHTPVERPTQADAIREKLRSRANNG